MPTKPNFITWCKAYRTEHHGSSLLEAKMAYETNYGVRLSDMQVVAGLLEAADRVIAKHGEEEHTQLLEYWVKEARSNFGL